MTPETISTTSLHMDIIRDLRRIHTHVVSVVYNVLEDEQDHHISQK